MYVYNVCVCECVYIYMEIIRIGSYDMKAEKSHSLPSASWKIRKARGVMQLKSEV